MKLKGKKVILLAENNYEDLELWVPYYRLKEE
ncbi:MAG: protease, partial [Thermodesulfobacteriota bacterium]